MRHPSVTHTYPRKDVRRFNLNNFNDTMVLSHRPTFMIREHVVLMKMELF